MEGVEPVKTQWWAWIVYLWIIVSIGCVGIAFGMLGGWQGPWPDSFEFSHRNDWLGVGLPGVIFGPIFAIAAAAGRMEARAVRRIETGGLEGVARVASCRVGRGHQNYKPVVVLDLEVEISGNAPFTTTKAVAIFPHLIERLTPGSTWTIRADPEHLETFVIEGIADEPV